MLFAFFLCQLYCVCMCQANKNIWIMTLTLPTLTRVRGGVLALDIVSDSFSENSLYGNHSGSRGKCCVYQGSRTAPLPAAAKLIAVSARQRLKATRVSVSTFFSTRSIFHLDYGGSTVRGICWLMLSRLGRILFLWSTVETTPLVNSIKPKSHYFSVLML